MSTHSGLISFAPLFRNQKYSNGYKVALWLETPVSLREWERRRKSAWLEPYVIFTLLSSQLSWRWCLSSHFFFFSPWYFIPCFFSLFLFCFNKYIHMHRLPTFMIMDRGATRMSLWSRSYSFPFSISRRDQQRRSTQQTMAYVFKIYTRPSLRSKRWMRESLSRQDAAPGLYSRRDLQRASFTEVWGSDWCV